MLSENTLSMNVIKENLQKKWEHTLINKHNDLHVFKKVADD